MRRTFTSAFPFATCLCLLVAGTSAPGAAQTPLAPTVSIYAGRTGTNAEGVAMEVNPAFLDARGILVQKDLPLFPGAGGTTIGDASFRIVRSAPLSEPITVRYTVSGTATAGTDYVALSGSIVIPAGVASVVLPSSVLDDAVTERDETLEVTLVAGAGYVLDRQPTSRRAQLVIVDDDQKLQLSTVVADAAEPCCKRGSVKLERLGTLRGDLKVGMRYAGTATRGVDYIALPDTVVIPAGQAMVILEVIPLRDAAVEGLESVSIAVGTLGSPSLINITDATITVRSSLSSLTEAAGNRADFVFTRTGDVSLPMTVLFTLSGTADRFLDYEFVAPQVTFAQGSATVAVPIVLRADDIREGAETITLTITSAPIAAGSPNSATLVITDNVPPTVVAMTLTPQDVVGGMVATGVFTLNGPAPEGGLGVQLFSSRASATLSATSVFVPAGQSTGSFSITTTPVEANTEARITATTTNGIAIQQQLRIAAPTVSALSVNDTAVTPQSARDVSSLSGVVRLTGAAPAGGKTIALVSSAPAAATVPASVTVAAGQSAATFPITVIPVVASTFVTLSASHGTQSVTQPFKVRAPRFTTLSMSPTSFPGTLSSANSTLGTFTLDGPVAAAGITLVASSDSPALIMTPPSVFLPGGTLSGEIRAKAIPLAVVNPIRITLRAGEESTNAVVNVVPPVPSSITVPPDGIVGGQSKSVTITLTGHAPTGGVVVPVSSNSAAAFPCEFPGGGAAVLSITTVPSGILNKPLLICTTPVIAPTTAIITAGQGSGAVSANLLITPPIAATAVVFPSPTVTDFGTINATVTISQPAPSGGSVVTLTSDSPALTLSATPNGGGQQQIQVTVPAGATSTGFSAIGLPVGADVTATVRAMPGNVAQSITVLAPTLTAVGTSRGGGLPPLSSDAMPGGTSRTFEVSLSARAPTGGMGVTLQSSSPLLTLPSIVTIPANQKTVVFTVSAASTPVDVDATITATVGGLSKSGAVRIVGPLTLSALSVAPTPIASGRSATGTVTLSSVAPAGGATVAMTSNFSRVEVPPSVTVAAGQSSASFPITARVFGSDFGNVTAQITATIGGVTRSANLTVVPFDFTSVNTPFSVVGGETHALTLQLNQSAPSDGLLVNVSSSNPAFPVPPTVTVNPGSTLVSFSVASTPVSENARITLDFTFDQAALKKEMTLQAPSLSAFTLAPPPTIKGGETVVGSITLVGKAPAGGFPVTVATDRPAVVTVPSTLIIPEGSNTATLSVVTGTVTATTVVSVTVSVGTTRITRSLTLTP